VRWLLLALLLPAPAHAIPQALAIEPDAGAGTRYSLQSIFISVCGSAVDATGAGWGARVVSGESQVCEILRVAAAFQAIGMHKESGDLLKISADMVTPKPTLTQRAARWVQGWILDPALELVPWIGDSAY
jgi:hypothetical protein